jgi:hypothetical protein
MFFLQNKFHFYFWGGPRIRADLEFGGPRIRDRWYCLQIEIEIRKPPFKIQETRASLSENAVGRGLKCCVVDPNKMSAEPWTDENWEKFIDGMFANFRYDKIPETTLASMGPAKRRMAKAFDQLAANKVHNKGVPNPGPVAMAQLTTRFTMGCSVNEIVNV